MISKLRFSLIAVIMLVLFGFGLQNEAKGQVAENVFCPGIPNTAGWLDLAVSSASSSFSAGLIGTVEGTAGGAVGGMDWLHADFTDIFQPFPTNTLGTQVVSWWTQAEGRATVLQVTNAFPEPIAVHVRVFGPNCGELTNFCDFYTGGDTHAYDFGDLITNDGVPANSAILQGTEGFVVVTAVDDCPSSDVAIDYNGLAATAYVLDADGYEYGFNAYHRAGVCIDLDEPATANLIDNGSFETGPGSVPEWFQVQGNSAVVEAANTSPVQINPPLCDDPADPECDAPNANRFMAFVASTGTLPSGFYGENAPVESITDLLASNNLIGGAIETNVSVLESNIFTPGSLNDGVTNGQVSYEINLLVGDEVECDQYAMVCTINVTDPLVPFFQECDCYVANGGAGTSPTGAACTSLPVSGQNVTVNATGQTGGFAASFAGGSSGFGIVGQLAAPQNGDSYVVQVITGEKTDCLVGDTVGAFVDNFRIIEEFNLVLECDGILTGAENAFLTSFTPTALAGQFNLLPGSEEAGADVVLINFQDSYGPPYQPVAAFSHYAPSIWDEFEVVNSCAQFDACYARLGIDDSIIDSDDFTPVGPTTTPPTITPTVPPTITPTVPPTITPTVAPTRTPSGGGGGSCAIAGSPVQLGTALANVLIPLVPVAFAFGVRRLRRKK